MKSKFKVLLYCDGSQHSFSAAVYTANLFQNMPDMHLTVVQVHVPNETSPESGLDLRVNWPINPNSTWMKKMLDGPDQAAKKQNEKIIAKTNRIFTARAADIDHDVINSNASFAHIADALVDYAAKQSYKMIIMGTRGLTSFKGLLFGSLAHNVLTKDAVPVLLIKKLPQDFIDNYCRDVEIKPITQ